MIVLRVCSTFIKIIGVILICLIANIQAIAQNLKPSLVVTYGDWGVFATSPGPVRICYSLSQPKRRQPSGLNREAAFIYISHRPADKVRNEISIISGFDIQPNTLATAEVGGRTFDLVAKSRNLWLKNGAEEGLFVEALRRGSVLTVSAQSMRNINNIDTFSLSGVGQAIERAEKECFGLGNVPTVARPLQQSPQSRTPQEPIAAVQQSTVAVNDTASLALRCHNESGRTAIAACDEAIRLNPNGVASYNNRGVAYRDLGNHDQAIRDFTVAISLDANFGRAHFNRARAYEAKGDFVSALSDLREYVRKGDSVPSRVDAEGRPTLQRLEKIVAALSNQTAQPSSPQPSASDVASSTIVSTQGNRIALIIGNTRYQNTARLENPTNDADLMAAAFKSVGFQSVMVHKDQTQPQILHALREFSALADNADWAVVYYSGHGIEFGGSNYLIPVEARLRSDRDIDLEGVDVGKVLSSIEGAKRLRLIILDACRDNPFASQMRRTMVSRSIGRGLARIEPEAGTLIAYAAKHGEVALDGDGKNSPYALALAMRLQQRPALEVRRLFDVVRDDVVAATSRKQQPFSYGSVSGSEEFFFAAR